MDSRRHKGISATTSPLDKQPEKCDSGCVNQPGIEDGIITAVATEKSPGKNETNGTSSPPHSKGRVAYLFTTFGRPSETFLRRELDAMEKQLKVKADIYSLWGGQCESEGQTIRKVPLPEMLTLFWRAFVALWRNPDAYIELFEQMLDRDIPNWVNFGENWRGVGCAILLASEMRKKATTRSHAVWASMPASAAWLLKRIAGIPYTMGAHAYDIYEHGGDWLLPIKLRGASLIHCSSYEAKRRVIALGGDEEKVVVIRRGLPSIPEHPKAPGDERARKMRLISVGRLVEKKGLRAMLHILSALAKEGQDFEARILGSGPLEGELKKLASELHIEDKVHFTGWLSEEAVKEELLAADAFLFTGRVAANGDRDGLPNALAEAMSCGVPVLTTNVGAISEVISNGHNGIILPLDKPEEWVNAIIRIANDDALHTHLTHNAHQWIVENFDAKKNASALLEETNRKLFMVGERGFEPRTS